MSRLGGVVVITSALHAEGPRFEPGSSQLHFVTSTTEWEAYLRVGRPVTRVARAPFSLASTSGHNPAYPEPGAWYAS